MGLWKLRWSSMQSEKGKLNSRQKPVLIGFTVIMITLVVSITFIGYINWQQYELSWPRIHIIIDRQADSPAAYSALEAAEWINYSEILNRPPFWTFKDSWEPDLEWETWINYINNYTVGHLLDRTEYQPQIRRHISIDLNYTARCFWMTNLTIDVYTDRLAIKNETDTIVFWGRPYSHWYLSYSAILVNDSFEVTQGNGFQPSISGNYGDVYFVYLGVEHEEVWSPVAAFKPTIDQYVILNASLDVQMVFTIDQGHAIA